jgi:hypothetical protein
MAIDGAFDELGFTPAITREREIRLGAEQMWSVVAGESGVTAVAAIRVSNPFG